MNTARLRALSSEMRQDGGQRRVFSSAAAHLQVAEVDALRRGGAGDVDAHADGRGRVRLPDLARFRGVTLTSMLARLNAITTDAAVARVHLEDERDPMTRRVGESLCATTELLDAERVLIDTAETEGLPNRSLGVLCLVRLRAEHHLGARRQHGLGWASAG